MHDACRWRLFVYELPDGYRKQGAAHGGGGGANASDELPLVSGNMQYALGAIFLERALIHGCRTLTPARADLFFVPSYNTQLVPVPGACCSSERRVALPQRGSR